MYTCPYPLHVLNICNQSFSGIDSATSKYSCIWCKCSSDERWDPDTKWTFSRTVEESTLISSQRKKSFNVSHPPLFQSIPLRNVVIDNLHLFLRVADVLINLLITELKRQDAIDKVKTFKEFNPERYRYLDKYQKFVTSLGVPDFQFYIGKNSKMLKCRTLTGPEKIKVFRSIKIAELLPTCETEPIQKLWDEFFGLNELFSRRPEDVSPAVVDEFERRARKWGKDFTDVYHTTNVTPYIHAMMNHVPEFMSLHGSILPFTQQGMEI